MAVHQDRYEVLAMITDEELKAIRERAMCVDKATSVEEYRKHWREFELFALEDVKALLDEVTELRKERATAKE
jgi:hypothetical protein